MAQGGGQRESDKDVPTALHKIVYGEVPVYFRDYFNHVRDIHSYSTRRSSTDFVPVIVGSEHFWNILPNDEVTA